MASLQAAHPNFQQDFFLQTGHTKYEAGLGEECRRWQQKNAEDGRSSFCTSVTCQDGVYAFQGKATKKRKNFENNDHDNEEERGRRRTMMTTRTRHEG
jgi:hypothetical protein